MAMASCSGKRVRTESDGNGGEEGEDGPLASLSLRGVASDHAGGWYAATAYSVLHVSAAGRVRRRRLALSASPSAQMAARCL